MCVMARAGQLSEAMLPCSREALGKPILQDPLGDCDFRPCHRCILNAVGNIR